MCIFASFPCLQYEKTYGCIAQAKKRDAFMQQKLLFVGSSVCIALAVVLAVIALLAHKRKRALWVMTGGAYFALVFLFLLTDESKLNIYSALIAADYSLDVFTLGYAFKDFIALFDGTDYQVYGVCLFLVAPVLTLSNVLALFQSVIDRLSYVIFPGTKYILSELNAESIALAKSIRKEHAYSQIIFAGVGNPEKKFDTKLLEKARELNALCLKQDVSRLYLGFLLRKNLVFLISRHESENVSDALALINKYKDTRRKIEIYVYASSPESKLAIDGANKGTRCLHPKFRSYLNRELTQLLNGQTAKNWAEIARVLDNAPLEGSFSVRCVDVVEQTVRNVLKEHYLTIHNQAKAQGRVVGITILGFGEHGAALLKNAAWIFQFYGYRLQFNIFDLDGSARKYLQQAAPMLRFDYSKAYADDASHDILFMGEDHGIDCLSSDFDELILETYWQRMQATQMVFVSLGDDSKNIAAAGHIRQLFQRKDIEKALEKVDLTGEKEETEKLLKNLKKKFDDPDSGCSPLIFAVVNDSRKAKNVEEASKGKTEDQARYNYHITPVASMLRAYDYKNLQEYRELEKSALKNHLSWVCKSVLTTKVTQVDKDTMDALVENAEKYVNYSYYRDSSVATTLHQKLLKNVQGELAEIAAKELKEAGDAQKETDEELQKRLSTVKKITEHMRWNAYMRGLGYQYLEVRNDRVKLHTLLVPYHELPTNEQDKDLIEF